MKFFFSILILVQFIGKTLVAQTVTTINYTNPGLGSSCNVFTSSSTMDHSVTYQNLKHQTTFGFPSYNGTETAIALQAQLINSTQFGATEYSIQYSFKKNYTYKIRVYGKTILGGSSSLAPSVAIGWSTSNGGTNTSTNCTGPSTVSNTFFSPTSYGSQNLSTTYAWTTYLINGVASQDYSFLLVGSEPNGNYQVDKTISVVLIQKIEITETANAPSFTLPSTTPVQCGSTSPITFTVTTASNPNNLPITDYTWNLGATPNGWLYNGSPAPATVSTGTSNTITLTPNCGSALSNISATVTAGGNTYNTNTSTINVTTPSLSVTGSDALCSGSATYSVANLPCNASVTWSASPSNIVSLSCTSCNSTTLTKTGDGSVTLTATVTSSTCSNLTPPSKPISVGNTVSGYYNVSSNYVVSYNNTLDYGGGSVFLPKNQSVLFSIQLTSNNLSNVSWGVSGSYSTYYNGSNFFNLYMTSPSSSWSANNATVTLNATGPCGSFSRSYNFQAVANGSYSYSMKASPNPATNTLNVAIARVADTSVTVVSKPNAAKTNASSGITRISLYDAYTNALIKQWTFAEKQAKNYNLNISGVPSGVYILKLERDHQSTTTKVIVQ